MRKAKNCLRVGGTFLPRYLSKTQQIFGKTQGFVNSSVKVLLQKSVQECPVNINLKQVSIPGKLRRSLDGRISRPLPSCCHPPMPQRKRDRIRTRRTWFHLGNDALACWKVEIKGIQWCVNVHVRVWKCGKVKATYLDNGKWRNSVKNMCEFCVRQCDKVKATLIILKVNFKSCKVN